MMRPRYVWLAFFMCLGVACAAMGWLSHTVLRLEHVELQTTRQSENERLALWRMDSSLVPLISRESARPAHEYFPFYQPENVYTRMFNKVDSSLLQNRSPLMGEDTPLIRLHFQFSQDCRLTSPQVPTESWRDFAEGAGFTTFEKIQSARNELTELELRLDFDELSRVVESEDEFIESPMDEQQAMNAAPNQPGIPQFQSENVFEQQLAQPLQQKAAQQAERSRQEFSRRDKATRGGRTAYGANAGKGKAVDAELPKPDRVAGPLRGVWVDDALLLVRLVKVGEASYIQGCLLDWPAIRDILMEDITDLLPAAALAPAKVDSPAGHRLQLAMLPVRLVPGAAPAVVVAGLTPMRFSLVMAWCGLVLAAIAVAGLLFSALRLSERRGSFVSAVTHELRTPLTTFRLYTEMLEEGKVATEEKRQTYLQTMRVEAERLGHLVENVLSYARLEATSRAVREDVDLREMLDRLGQSLRDRAERSNMRLEINIPDEDPWVVSADSAGVERIVFNLVDNACKYASEVDECRIHVECRREDRGISLVVRDHGRGINRKETRKLFRAFSKSADEAAHSAPGVGLGLALCRRLARNMGGKLQIDHKVRDGACFVLTLPVAV